jgi:hypothetical protein
MNMEGKVEGAGPAYSASSVIWWQLVRDQEGGGRPGRRENGGSGQSPSRRRGRRHCDWNCQNAVREEG